MTSVIVPKVPADPDKIRKAIRACGLAQAVVAQRAGIEKTTLSKQLGGYRPVDLEDLFSIAVVVGVPWRSLLVDACEDCGAVHCFKGHSEVAA